MAETLRELVVALSLDSSNFSRNMRTINQRDTGETRTVLLSFANNKEKTPPAAKRLPEIRTTNLTYTKQYLQVLLYRKHIQTANTDHR